MKCAMLVGEGVARQFRDAVLECCTTWGGITDPIIPVGRGLRIEPLYVALLKLHEPDGAISFLPAGSECGRRRHLRLQRKLDEILGRRVPLHAASDGDWEISCHVLSVIRDEDLMNRQFMSTRSILSGRSEDLPLLTLFGRIFPGQESDYAQLTHYGERMMGYGDTGFWDYQTTGDPFASPINLTGYGYGPREVVGSFGAELVELVLGDDLEALTYFWNVRAARQASSMFGDRTRRVLLGPRRLLEDRESMGRLADTIRRVGPTEGVESNVELLVYGRSDEVGAFEAAGRRFRMFRRERGELKVTHRFAGPPSEIVRSGVVTWATPKLHLPEAFKYGAAFEGHDLFAFRPGVNDVRVVRPAGLMNRTGQHVMLDFESDLWSRFVKSQGTAQAVQLDARWSRHGLTLSRDVPSSPVYYQLTVPDEFDVLRAYFRDRGIEIRETKLSGYFDAAVRLIGGFDKLNMLTSRCAYGLVDALATKSPKKIAQKLRIDPDLHAVSEEAIESRLREAGVVLDLSLSKTAEELKNLESLQSYRRDVLPILTDLSSCGVVRRGLHLDCPACGLLAWHPIGTLDEQVGCPGCGNRRPVPAEYPAGSGREIEWSYSLNSLVNRVWDQDLGPVLVTMAHILRGAEEPTCRGAGIEVVKDGTVVGDLDWISFRKGQLVGGEAKAGRVLARKDFVFARTMLEAGVDEFFFSTVDTYSEASRSGVSELEKAFGPGRVSLLEGEQMLAG